MEVNYSNIDDIPRLKPNPLALKAVMKDHGLHVEDGKIYHKKEQDVSEHIKFMRELRDEIATDARRDNLVIRRTISCPKVELMIAQAELKDRHGLDPHECDDQYYYYRALKKYMSEHPRMRNYVLDVKSTNRVVVA